MLRNTQYKSHAGFKLNSNVYFQGQSIYSFILMSYYWFVLSERLTNRVKGTLQLKHGSFFSPSLAPLLPLQVVGGAHRGGGSAGGHGFPAGLVGQRRGRAGHPAAAS